MEFRSHDISNTVLRGCFGMGILEEAAELLESSMIIHLDAKVLSEDESFELIQNCIHKFEPEKDRRHLHIGKNSVMLPLDGYEFTYSKLLCSEPGFIFFDQRTELGKKTVVKINDITKVGMLFENSYGMEYFLSNENLDFLIAVNWYAVEICGESMAPVFQKLLDVKE